MLDLSRIRSCATLVSCAALALAAPAHAADPRFTWSGGGRLPAPAAGQAVVVLVREQFVRQTPMKPERVFVDATPLGWLPQGGYVVARVPAGVHTFWGPLNCPPLTFRARAGSTWLVRLRESIDDNDALHSHWLFDDPGNFAGLADDLRLREARVTARGMRELAERAGQAPAPAAPDTRTEFDGIVSQLTPAHPRERYAGLLTLEPDSLRYAVDVPVTQGSSERVFMSLSIPWQNVRGVHFGGSASSDTLPWLAVDYDERGERRTATFAHANPADAFDAYDAMFLAIERVRRRGR